MIKITITIKNQGCYTTSDFEFENQEALDKFFEEHTYNAHTKGKVIGVHKKEII